MSARRKGFTLIELLVVISIIAILSTIGMSLYGSVQGNARDAARKSDIDAIANALEAHYTAGSANPYPIPLATWFNAGAIPQDPQGATKGYYWNGGSENVVPTSTNTGYVVCAKLEMLNTGNSGSKGESGFTFTSSGSLDYYCRKNLQ